MVMLVKAVNNHLPNDFIDPGLGPLLQTWFNLNPSVDK